MWKFLARTTRLRELRQLLSPKFFRVFPSSKISRALREVIGNYRDEEKFEMVLDQRQGHLEASDIPIRLELGRETQGHDRVEVGRSILALYFRQLFDPDPALLDVRRERFDTEGADLVWSPLPLYVDWDETFLDGVRSMYHGFYAEDRAEFEAGLATLDLQGMGDLFLRHFGDGRQRAVTFEMDHFYESFHDVLGRCADQNRSLHYNFAMLGLYLACLYDHLEQLGGEYDVRGVFEQVVLEA